MRARKNLQLNILPTWLPMQHCYKYDDTGSKRFPALVKNNHRNVITLEISMGLSQFKFAFDMRNQMIPVVIPGKANLPICACCGFNLNFGYLKSYPGLLKILQLIIAGLCKSMLMNFGLKYASMIGFSYDAFLSVISGSVITTSILLLTYIWSENSMRLMRSSLFEVFFNGSACLNFMGSCSWLLLAVHTFLYPDFLTIPFFFIYPVMVAVNILGFLLSLIYGIDCYLAYKYYKGYR